MVQASRDTLRASIVCALLVCLCSCDQRKIGTVRAARPDGTEAVVSLWERDGLIGKVYYVELDRSKEELSYGWEQGYDGVLQSADKRRLITFRHTRGSTHSGIQFDLVTGETKQYWGRTYFELKDDRNWTVLEWEPVPGVESSLTRSRVANRR